MKIYTRKVTLSIIMFFIALVIQYAVKIYPSFGTTLRPIHIVVILCGFLCGPIAAMTLGFVIPPMSAMLFSVPAVFPTGFVTAFELAAYGFFTGSIYGLMRKNAVNIYITLISSMLVGRLVLGAAMFTAGISSTNKFTFGMYFSEAFTSCFLGILLHLAVIPPVVYVCERFNLMGRK